MSQGAGLRDEDGADGDLQLFLLILMGKRQTLDGRQKLPHTQKLLETTWIDGQALPDISKDSPRHGLEPSSSG